MQEVWLAGAAPYPLMCLLGQEKCPFYEIPVLVVLTYLGAREEQIVPLFLDYNFILGSIIHTLLFRCLHGLAYLGLDFVAEPVVVFQQLLHGVASLADLAVAVREPRAGFLDHAVVDAQVDDLADLRDALAEHDVEFRTFERGCHLVLHDLHLRACSQLFLAVLDDRHAADVDAHAGVEFQGIAARRGLGITVDDTDLVAQLVDEDADRLGLRDARRQLAQCLRHQAGLEAHL